MFSRGGRVGWSWRGDSWAACSDSAALIRVGESVHLLRMVEGGLRLWPAASWDIVGGPDPATWRYACQVAGPSGDQQVSTSAAGVVHCRYATDPARPWAGMGPLQVAASTSSLLGALERSLRHEAGGTVGRLLAIPAGGDDDTVEDLRADLRTLKGRTALLETTADAWGQGRSGAPQRDWMASRLGPEFTAATATIADQVSRAVVAAAGIPVDLYAPGSGREAQRESWRRLLHGTVQPLGELIGQELSTKLEQPVAISFDKLMASDLMGKARAFQSLTGGGMDLGRASQLAGFDN